jgi:hypothetical protein
MEQEFDFDVRFGRLIYVILRNKGACKKGIQS